MPQFYWFENKMQMDLTMKMEKILSGIFKCRKSSYSASVGAGYLARDMFGW